MAQLPVEAKTPNGYLEKEEKDLQKVEADIDAVKKAAQSESGALGTPSPTEKPSVAEDKKKEVIHSLTSSNSAHHYIALMMQR